MKLLNTFYTPWKPIDSLPTEAKLLKKELESGTAAIIADIGLNRTFCGLTENAENTEKILFVKLGFLNPELFPNPARLDAIKAIGYLAMEEYDDAGTLFYSACIENSIKCADNLWYKHCRWNENFCGYVIVDGEPSCALQGYFPDSELAKKLLKIINKKEKNLKEEIMATANHMHNSLKDYRRTLKSSHLTRVSDTAFEQIFNEDKTYLLSAYKNLKNHLHEIMKIPELFGSKNYLLHGGTYRDIEGICKLVDIKEIEDKNWSLYPDDYL